VKGRKKEPRSLHRPHRQAPKKEKEKHTMRVIVMVKATAETENNENTTPEQMEQMFLEMGKYNEELVNAGIMLSGEGLLPSSTGHRINFRGDERTVVDGPFTESKELVAGFWIWQVDSMEQAVEWAKKCPNPKGQDGQLEIRQIASAEEFGEAYTPEVKEQEDRIRAKLEKRQG
jgi:hypothetical protein